MKVLVRNFKKFFWKEGDFHTQYGVIKEGDIKKSKGVVKSHSDKEFVVYDANFIDKVSKIRRGPQTLLLKDLAYIVFNSGVDSKSLVVDAGSGCGLLAACLGRVAKKVVSYDTSKENVKLAKRNLKFLGIDNVEVKNGDVYDKIDEKNVDVLTLDLPEPWQVDLSCVKSGGTIVAYLPTTVQVQQFVETVKDGVVEKVVEILEREWYVSGKKVRPMSQMMGHTAFLVFVRRL